MDAIVEVHDSSLVPLTKPARARESSRWVESDPFLKAVRACFGSPCANASAAAFV